MSLLNDRKIPLSSHDGRQAVTVARPSAWKTFLFLTLPFSFIPPLMLIYAGSHHATQYLVDEPPVQWNLIASVFLVGELLTVPLLAWAIKSIAAVVHHIAVDFKDTFLLAAIAVLPIWLSALGLAIPYLWAMAGVIIAGLIAGVNLLYRASRKLLNLEEQMEAQSLTYAAFAASGVVWIFVCAFFILPLMGE